MDLILVAGLWLKSDVWDRVVEHLRELGHDATAVELPGADDGSSEASLEDQLQAVLDVRDALEVQRRAAPDQAVDLVTLLEQELREVAAVLPGDSGDQCPLHVVDGSVVQARRRSHGGARPPKVFARCNLPEPLRGVNASQRARLTAT